MIGFYLPEVLRVQSQQTIVFGLPLGIMKYIFDSKQVIHTEPVRLNIRSSLAPTAKPPTLQGW